MENPKSTPEMTGTPQGQLGPDVPGGYMGAEARRGVITSVLEGGSVGKNLGPEARAGIASTLMMAWDSHLTLTLRELMQGVMAGLIRQGEADKGESKRLSAIRLVGLLCAAYPAAPFTKQSCELYEETLMQLDAARAEHAVHYHIANTAHLPTIAEILATARRLEEERRPIHSARFK